MVQKKRKAASTAAKDPVPKHNKPNKQKMWIDFL